MMGTSSHNLEQALNTYDVPTGPGQYNLPDLVASKQTDAKKRNGPSYTIGSPRIRVTLNPDTREAIPTVTKSPSPDKYRVPDDNVRFKKLYAPNYSEKKFFEIGNMPRIRQQVPVQYCNIDGMSANRTFDLRSDNSQVSAYMTQLTRVGVRYK